MNAAQHLWEATTRSFNGAGVASTFANLQHHSSAMPARLSMAQAKSKRIVVRIMPSDEAIMADMHRICLLGLKWENHRSAVGLYEYLDGVLSWYSKWKRRGLVQRVARRAAVLTSPKMLRDAHPTAVVIAITTTADRRTKSRWVRALRYAWRTRGHYPNLHGCLIANGGISGCASLYAAARR